VRALPCPDIEELRAFAEYEPLPDPYWIGAQICHLIYSVNRDKKSPKYEIEDFIPRPRAEGRRQTDEEMRAVLLAVTGRIRNK
jgi:hypothetical protein